MIQIHKSKSIPKKLQTKGLTETNRLKQLFLQDKDYKKGIKKFEFDNKIYGHFTVKKALLMAHFEKCCFCERKIESGHVEHFRGKGGYQQSESEKIQKPGYYWLAYEWSNLFLSCAKCNSSYKRNFFPLANPTKRATSHLKDINKEKPLLIDPEKENPEDFIEFIGYSPKAINGNQKGKETILRIGLDRPFLGDRRRDIYLLYKKLFFAAQSPNLPDSEKKELNDLLAEQTKPEAQYSSMIKCAIRDKFRF